MPTVNVVGLPEFVRCMHAAVRTEDDDSRVDKLLDLLSQRHQDPKMRAGSIRIEGTEVHLWATQDLRLSSGRYKVAWRYEVRDDNAIVVCYTLAVA